MQVFFQLSPRKFHDIYENRALKETPLPEFTVTREAAEQLYAIIKKPYLLTNNQRVQLSIRDAMIYLSECVCKPAFGKTYFGEARAKTITENELAIDDSCGFEEEIKPTLDKLGADNVMLIRVRGRGSFEGDSRNFIPDGVVPNTIDVLNHSTEQNYLTAIHTIAYTFYGKENARVR